MSARTELEAAIAEVASWNGFPKALYRTEYLRRIPALLDAFVAEATRDAETVEGDHEVYGYRDGFLCSNTKTGYDIFCEDERTAIAYASALNRADRYLEGTK